MPMFLYPVLWSADASSTRLDRGRICIDVDAGWRWFELAGKAFQLKEKDSGTESRFNACLAPDMIRVRLRHFL